MDGDNRPSLKGIIHPEHLLQAIKNSLEHSDETAHGVTGLTFKRYTITVRKKAGLSWSVECRFRKEDTDLSLQATTRSRSRCRTQPKSR
jgi:Viral (Superfamily 1) RNA helicase